MSDPIRPESRSRVRAWQVFVILVLVFASGFYLGLQEKTESVAVVESQFELGQIDPGKFRFFKTLKIKKILINFLIGVFRPVLLFETETTVNFDESVKNINRRFSIIIRSL